LQDCGASRIADCHRPAVPALDAAATGDLDKHRIGHASSFRHAERRGNPYLLSNLTFPSMLAVLKTTLAVVLLVFIAPVFAHAVVWFSKERPRNWHSADWSSAGVLPTPGAEPEASIRVLAARTGGLKGIVSVHSWLVLKEAGASQYERYDVVGWGNPVRLNSQPADGRWYSNDPVVLYELKGAGAETLLPKVKAAIRGYQWSERGSYRTWPGPNSNTFVATVLAAVPDLRADLPSTAIGRDYPSGSWLRRTPLGGWSATLGGLLGVTLGPRDGFAVNLLGLVAGIRLQRPAILLPGFGALGEPF